ncbi:MAG TPA: signal recognition particle-docking protein FtsY [Anaerolineae bacterium]|nr:signal recognition particle-docking protein FtsY [Anaerolineae bacterium]MCB0177521.1 signal recognition particle-docking protein FtsY [Anaerolineae bacterium]MCB9075963.1 signal recognition particle-docking protein FtsY [Anaerolineaceae bacterium]MCB9107536.1 signal recognition particle-docking protein FtsY [Anaerolineales bacterium]HRV92018.1 signal recognition particle-docking protein FtsY [Anaerolineae bacterium]
MFGFNRNKIKEGLSRTRNSVFGQITTLFGGGDIDDEFWEDLEALLIQADVGAETSMELIETVRKRVERDGIYKAADAKGILKEEMQHLLDGYTPSKIEEHRLVTVILVVGVNGSGKTTTIAKLAHYYQQQGRRVVLGAADTFRAAAIDQLKIWGERAGVTVIAHQENADPGAVVFDSLKSALARKADMVIIDTAGRLHTKFNLMKELEKLKSIARKQVHAAPHETLLVLDGTTGQNALSQAKHFKKSVEITGVVVTKLDGTAKGGVVLAIGKTLEVPVRFIGVGEGLDDLMPFDSKAFVDALFDD